jgi:chorismate synthase
MMVKNKDARPQAYDEMKEKFRPSHADYTYFAKYGLRNWQGGGRSSARETIGRVAAGAVAKQLLRELAGVEILACVERIHHLHTSVDPDSFSRDQVEANIVRCPDPQIAEEMVQLVDQARRRGDSVGGIILCAARHVPAGLGDPVFDKLDATLAHACMSIPATRGIEFGSGFDSVLMTGIEHNDAYEMRDGGVHTRSNRSGGIQGGISNGETIYFRVAFKPTATVMVPQDTVTEDFQNTVLQGRGRHDPCVLPRAVPIIEAMTALTLADHLLRWRGQCGEAGLRRGMSSSEG